MAAIPKPSPTEALNSLDDMLRASRPWLISANGAQWVLARCDSRHEAIGEAIRRFKLGVGERIWIGRIEWSGYEKWQDDGNEDLNPSDVEEVLVGSDGRVVP